MRPKARRERRNFFSHNRLCDPIYRETFSHDAKYAQRVIFRISHLRKHFRRIVDFPAGSVCSIISARFKKKKNQQMENRNETRVPEDFAFIARKYFFAVDGRRTHTRHALVGQYIRSMTHFAREVTRTVPKLDLIDRLYYLALSTAFCSWNLNRAKIRDGYRHPRSLL